MFLTRAHNIDVAYVILGNIDQLVKILTSTHVHSLSGKRSKRQTQVMSNENNNLLDSNGEFNCRLKKKQNKNKNYSNCLKCSNWIAIDLILRCRVSSILNKDNKQHGRRFMFDGQDDTAWSSDQVNFSQQCERDSPLLTMWTTIIYRVFRNRSTSYSRWWQSSPLPLGWKLNFKAVSSAPCSMCPSTIASVTMSTENHSIRTMWTICKCFLWHRPPNST